jgi:hypothetical protein
MRIEGYTIPRGFLQVDTQAEVGTEAYDVGAAELKAFFGEQLQQFMKPELDEDGRKIIQAFLDDATIADYEALMNADSASI